MIRGVLFDFGGVLTYSCWDLKVMSELIRQAFAERGIYLGEEFDTVFIDVMEEAWNRVIKTLKEEKIEELISIALGRLGINPDEKLIMESVERIKDAPFCRIRENAKSVLSWIKRNGLKTAVVSNAPINFHEHILKSYGIYDYIDTIVVSCDIGYRKPHPKIYEYVLEQLSLKPKEAIFIGDVLDIDIYGAKKLGMICVLMKEPEPYMANKIVPKYGEVKPDFIIEDLPELIDIIKYLNNISKYF